MPNQSVLLFPRRDDALLAWSAHLIEILTPAPTDFGVSSTQLTTYQGQHDSFAAAVAACAPTIRTKAAVAGKDIARQALKDGATIIANQVYATPTVTVEQKVELGIPPRATPTPIPAPSMTPTIKLLSLSGWTTTIRLLAGDLRGKPPGTFGASVFSYIGNAPPTNLGAWKFEGSTGRVEKIDVTFSDTLPAGTTVWLTAFYFNGRKESGPMCPPVSCNLPGGGVGGMPMKEAA